MRRTPRIICTMTSAPASSICCDWSRAAVAAATATALPLQLDFLTTPAHELFQRRRQRCKHPADHVHDDVCVEHVLRSEQGGGGSSGGGSNAAAA